jgi:hypothetical protein
MTIQNYTLKQFAMLSEDKQVEFLTLCELSAMPYSVADESVKFGQVKWLQMLLSKEQTFEVMQEVVSYVLPKGTKSAYYFFAIYYGIIKEIVQISEKENYFLSTNVDSKAVEAAQKVGGFEMFGKFPEIYNLCNGDYDKGYNLPYTVGFTIMIYKKRQYDFEREYYKIK